MTSNLIELKPIKMTKLKQGAELLYKNTGGSIVEKARLKLTYKFNRDSNGRVIGCNVMMTLQLNYKDGTRGVLTYPIQELLIYDKNIMAHILHGVVTDLLKYPIGHHFNSGGTGGNNEFLVLNELAPTYEEMVINLLYEDEVYSTLIDALQAQETTKNEIRKSNRKQRWVLANRPIAKNQGPITREA